MSIEVQHLSFSYGSRQVLKDISFSVGKGEFLSILGPNGVGKSTLFRCILGLLSGYTGDVMVDGVNARSFSVPEAAKHIAYIPQSSRPIFNYSVFDIVLMGRSSSLSPFRSPGKQDNDRCRWALDKVGISHLSQRCYHRLSGGEQQMLAMGRALMAKPRILLLDEPSMGLSPLFVGEVFKIIQEVSAAGTTVLLVEQNAKKALSISDRAYVLETGKIVKSGKASDLLNDDSIKKAYLGE